MWKRDGILLVVSIFWLALLSCECKWRHYGSKRTKQQVTKPYEHSQLPEVKKRGQLL